MIMVMMMMMKTVWLCGPPEKILGTVRHLRTTLSELLFYGINRLNCNSRCISNHLCLWLWPAFSLFSSAPHLQHVPGMLSFLGFQVFVSLHCYVCCSHLEFTLSLLPFTSYMLPFPPASAQKSPTLWNPYSMHN